MELAPLIAAALVITCASTWADYNGRCKTEFYYGSTSMFQWDAAEGEGVYQSKPLCLNENYDVVTRHCYNSVWYPKNFGGCYNFKCPKPFSQAIFEECSYNVERQSLDDQSCPNVTSIISNRSDDEKPAASEDRDCFISAIFSSNVPKKCPLVCSYGTDLFLALPQSPHQINVTLIFDAKQLKLLLTVYSAELLDKIDCFTNDADAIQQIDHKSVDTVRVYDSRNSSVYEKYSLRNLSVHEVKIEGPPRQYWCQVFEAGKVRPIRTPRVVAYEEKLGVDYALSITVNKSRALERVLTDYCQECRTMEILLYTKSPSIVLHLSWNSSGIIKEFADTKHVRVLDFRSAEFCLPEATISGKQTLHWRLTPLGITTRPEEKCPNGFTVTRRCGGDFLYGAKWEDVEGTCFSVFRSVAVASNRNLFGAMLSLSPFYNQNNPKVFFEQIRDTNDDAIRDLQASFNVTDRILDVLDNSLVQNNTDVIPRNLMVFDFNNVSAVALRKGALDYPLDKNSTYRTITKTDLELAVFFDDRFPPNRASIAIFNDDRLFLDPHKKSRAGSKIVRVASTGFDSDESDFAGLPVIVMFKERGRFGVTSCASWDYGEGRQGRWTTLGGDRVERIDGNFTVCAFSRFGHFAVLVSAGDNVTWDVPEEYVDQTSSMQGVFEGASLAWILAGCCLFLAVLVVGGIYVGRRCATK